MVLGQFGPQISENLPRTIRDAVPQLGVKPALNLKIMVISTCLRSEKILF